MSFQRDTKALIVVFLGVFFVFFRCFCQPVSKGRTPPPPSATPADLTQKEGAQSLRPEWPPGRHVGFLLRFFSKMAEGPIQALGPGSPLRIQYGGGAVQALGPAAPQPICWISYEIFNTALNFQKKQLTHFLFFLHKSF